MASQEGKYNIKAVSKMLGIQAGTLRAWERRYSIIEPKRNEAGHRLYTDEHIYIIKWLMNKIKHGFTISQAVDLLEHHDNKISQIIVESSGQTDVAMQLSDELLSALMSFDERKAKEVMDRAFSLFTIEKVTIDILGSLLVKVGDMWESKRITVAHEHYASSFLKAKIGNILFHLPVDSYLPKVIAVCGLKETHELGLLIFTLYLRQKGFEVIYLGEGIPPEDLDVVIREIDPKLLFVSCTVGEHLPLTIEWLKQAEHNHPSLQIGLGGLGLEYLSNDIKTKIKDIIIGKTKTEWDQWIHQKLKEEKRPPLWSQK
ncbi:MerR family transcriptional regulator [Fictibacillus fluitans]|uniref:MerR family transcriptional regulator n=1 Tax=Fictibacillus fluitans TaxID=3058422 RepID=A0ABT8I480_9BACL|nr:MerR family transcriptional regulator [Fictibacillus sp. NE201]MDN4527357.1 MerR family transcriptional regulator [Fictibacillus sp. NE201]